MRLAKLRIENFRAFSDATIDFNDYTCLVGPNGTGKSCVIAALDVLFKHPVFRGMAGGVLSEEDFHQRQTATPVRITATFDGLSAEAQEDLKHYVRQGKLVLSAVAEWNPEKKQAEVVQKGNRLVMADFAKYFAADSTGAKAPELKQIYAEAKQKYPDLPAASTKDDMRGSLQAYEERHPELTSERPSTEDFYGVAGSGGRLAKHLQWVHVPAVKDAADEEAETKNTWLGQLLQRAVRSAVSFDSEINGIRTDAEGRYRTVLEAQQGTLKELSESLTKRITEWAHPDASLRLKWDSDPNSAVTIKAPFARVEAGDGVFEGALFRHGHGFQRSYLLSLLQELAQRREVEVGSSTLLLAVEEPELFQHPPQARHLAGVLEALTEKGAQVIVCTHSPYFVSGKGFPDIRVLRRPRGVTSPVVSSADLATVQTTLKSATGKESRSLEGARIKLHQHLNPLASEIFFAPVIVLVEGHEDMAYIHAHLHLTGKGADFRRLGCHVVPADRKSNIPVLLAITQSLEIPAFTIFDADSDQCVVPDNADEKKKEQIASRRAAHEHDNRAILTIAGYASEAPLPTDTLWKGNLIAWKNNLGDSLAEEIGAREVTAAREAVRDRELLTDGNLDKSALYVGYVMEELWSRGRRSKTLDRLCDAVVVFAKSVRGESVTGFREQAGEKVCPA